MVKSKFENIEYLHDFYLDGILLSQTGDQGECGRQVKISAKTHKIVSRMWIQKQVGVIWFAVTLYKYLSYLLKEIRWFKNM
jgi:hypothetical protein